MLRTHRFYAEMELGFNCTYCEYQLLALFTMKSHFRGSRNRPEELLVNTWCFFSVSPLTYPINWNKNLYGKAGGEGQKFVYPLCSPGAQNLLHLSNLFFL